MNDIITITVAEDNSVTTSRDHLPRHWDQAHGAPPVQPGTYYYVLRDSEPGNAWAWIGPYSSESAALAAIKEE